MTRINTNVASLRGLRSMGKANQLLDNSLTRLSTGLKINSGRDNPSGLIASETLRSQISTIEQSIRNSNRANNVIATADGALGEIGGLLTQVRGLVQEGLNRGALSQSEIEANQLQIDAALSAINRISANTTFAGDKLIDGSKSFVTSVAPAHSAKLSDFRINEAVLGSAGSLTLDARIDTVAEKASLLYTGRDLTAKATLEVGGSKGTEVVFLGGSASVTDVKNAINSVSDTTGVAARIVNGASVQSTTLLDFEGENVYVTLTQKGTDLANKGKISVELVNDATNNGTTTATLKTNNDGTYSILVELADDGTDITADVDAVVSAINGLKDSNGNLIAEATVDAGSAGATVLTGAVAPQELNSGSLRVDDVRGPNAKGTISIVYAAGAADDPLSVATAVTGNDTVITVTLAADSDGLITSTIEDVIAALQSSTEAVADGTTDGTTVAKALFAYSKGDATALVGTLASTDLNEQNGSTIAIESTGYGSAEFVNVNVLSGSFSTTRNDYGTVSSRDTGVDIGVTINGQAAYGRGLTASVRTNTLDASISFKAGSNVRNESAAIEITGGGSLFQIGQEVSPAGQIGIGIEAVNTARLGGVNGKLYELGTGGGKSLLDVAAGSATGADLVGILDDAINRVSTMRGRLGAIQKNVIETNTATLGVALENISEARSQIVDTDFAEETANLTKAQILSQASMSILAIANQNPQQVLSLLG